MTFSKMFSPATLTRDLVAGLVVFLVALPLCLGIALASNAPLFSGVLTGIVGGIVVGLLSGSHTSVSGPGNCLMAIIAAQILLLGSFEAFLLAVVIGGVIQIALGLMRAGFISAFVPSSVIQGLLASIGIILILKQIPHLLGRDTDPEGEMSFIQPDHENTFSEFGFLLGHIHPGAAVVGLASIAILLFWHRVAFLKRLPIPAQLVVVLLGVTLSQVFQRLGGQWVIQGSHLVQVPVADSLASFWGFLRMPDFSQLGNPAVYTAGLMIAIVASLETLLNLEAVDRIDPQQRQSPPSRELVAQGIGNVIVGLIGGIPISSVIVRSSVNINAGGQTKMATVFHGTMLLICVMFLPQFLNMVPLSCLAAILFVTGMKLASPQLIFRMWNEGRYQFIPFIVTLVAMIFTDLLVGVLVGLAVSLTFILNSNLRRPLRRVVEKHLGGEVLHIELANQVSFLNRAALENVLRGAARGTHVLLDAHNTDYIDPDILNLIRDFKERTAPIQGVQVSLSGFRDKYQLNDEIQFVDYSTRELQGQITTTQVLQILEEGNERFRTGRRLSRDLGRQLHATSQGQHPLAVVLSCIDSRTPAELIFDLGLGDIFSIRVAGNVSGSKVLGSIEYGSAVAGAKLVLVVGHTKCGAVTASVNLACSTQNAAEATGCQHLDTIVDEIQQSLDEHSCRRIQQAAPEEKQAFVDSISRQNVLRVVREIVDQSSTIQRLVDEGRIAVVGAMYDVSTGKIDFLTEDAIGLPPSELAIAESV
ncbi:MAG: SulP family inorganic anion transporter [Planctomycetota bacterium]